MTEQTFLPRPYEIGNNSDFTDVVCEDCAKKFATENGLVWRGNTSHHSFTEYEGEGAYASCIEGYALGDSDTPYSCCGIYLDTNLTAEGFNYLEERDFPEWVKKLYIATK